MVPKCMAIVETLPTSLDPTVGIYLDTKLLVSELKQVIPTGWKPSFKQLPIGGSFSCPYQMYIAWFQSV
jgi:hypothetical protein